MKRIFTLLCVTIFSLTTMADGVKIGDLYYLLDSTNYTASVTYTGESSSSGNNYSGDIVIPDSIYYADQSYIVTTIGEEALGWCSGLTSVTIGSSVAEIGVYAFSKCPNLKSIIVADDNPKYDSRDNCNAIIETATNTIVIGCVGTIIPHSVTSIGAHSFDFCSGLTSLEIPSSVTSIGDYAFGACTSLTSITLPNSITSMGKGAFRSCSGITSINIPNSITSISGELFFECSSLTSVTIPNSVTTIGNYAFRGCSGLTSVTIPNSITTIEKGAFYYCISLTSVTIGNSVAEIGVYAFSECPNLTSIIVADDNPKYDSRDNCNAIIETVTNTIVIGCVGTIIPNSVTSIGAHSFDVCNGLTSLEIPSSVTSIGDYAFGACTSLTSITLPNSITSMGKGAFRSCSGITSINIPNSITSISGELFFECSSLTSVTIPNSVTTIGADAFYKCSGLTSIICLAIEPPSLGDDVFDSVPRNIPLYVPAKSVSAYQAAEQWNEFNILPLLMDVDPITPDTTKLSWLPVDSASMYQLHIYAEQVGLDTTLYIEADSLNGGIRIPVTMAPKRITLDDVGSIIVIEIDPYSGIDKETPYVVTVSTTSTDRIDVGFDLTVLCGAKVLKDEVGSFTFNIPIVDGIDDVFISNWSSTPSIYDLYGHRYSTNQWSSVPAGIYILREGNKAVKVMKQ
ncbi:MAG: leucine-rich repeat domain-containing protein [Bacteroidaceae bacterium]|nr:leucine-rich repeat domain-containing protein [Bacteroidaceae bacterium]